MKPLKNERNSTDNVVLSNVIVFAQHTIGAILGTKGVASMDLHSPTAQSKWKTHCKISIINKIMSQEEGATAKAIFYHKELHKECTNANLC